MFYYSQLAVQVTLFISDVNDEVPEFVNLRYKESIYEVIVIDWAQYITSSQESSILLSDWNISKLNEHQWKLVHFYAYIIHTGCSKCNFLLKRMFDIHKCQL